MKALLWIVIIYAGYGLALFLLQRAVIFPRYVIPKVDNAGIDFSSIEKMWLPLQFGKVEAWYLPPAECSGRTPYPVVIYGHGNAELIDFNVQDLLPFTDMGLGVLLVEFPGYGRSGGTPSQKSIRETFVAAYDTIARRPEIDGHRIIFYGRSMGGGAVCALLKERRAAALILMSTFTSIRSFAKRYLIPAILVRDPFDNLAALRHYRGPVLLFHGRQDQIVPFRHGETLSQAAPNARFIPYDCGHNDCPPDPASFWKAIQDFLVSNNLLAG
ncbi:MAG: alpha/beta hydrolase [Deltaproteobacteria bacterium]|jgi:hypothetical protein